MRGQPGLLHSKSFSKIENKGHTAEPLTRQTAMALDSPGLATLLYSTGGSRRGSAHSPSCTGSTETSQNSEKPKPKPSNT